MLEDIIIPKLYEDMEKAVFVEWLKNVGDTVEAEDVIFTLETDKSVFDVESEFSGVIKEATVESEAEVIPMQVVGKIEAEELI